MVAATATAKTALSSIAVIIPAWQPDGRLTSLVDDLQTAGLAHILVVDDGSTPDRQPLFAELARRPSVRVLHHHENQGKGCALKTAFRRALTAYPEFTGVVTADADGQHLAADILRVAQHLAGTGTRPVLGVRSFVGNVPLRSRLGNLSTRHLFALLTGEFVSDTQTGLRGLPLSLLRELIALPGERYEYELSMLAHLCRPGKPDELPIQTVYLGGNSSSHFHPLRDSLRIYSTLIRLAGSRQRRPEHTDPKRNEPQPHLA